MKRCLQQPKNAKARCIDGDDDGDGDDDDHDDEDRGDSDDDDVDVVLASSPDIVPAQTSGIAMMSAGMVASGVPDVCLMLLFFGGAVVGVGMLVVPLIGLGCYITRAYRCTAEGSKVRRYCYCCCCC